MDRKGVILPAYKGRWNVNWTKAGAILPERIGGRYWMYYMADAKDARDQTGVAYSTDLINWTEALDHPVLPRRPGRFDSRVVEPGPPPLLTPDGVLLIYNGADDRLVYRTGWALFDRNDPTRLLARSDQPLFEPVADWEKVGQVPNVVFVEGLLVEPGRWLVYTAPRTSNRRRLGGHGRCPLIEHAQIFQAAAACRARPRGLWSWRPARGSGPNRRAPNRPVACKRLQERRRGRGHRGRQPAGGEGRPGADASVARLPGPRDRKTPAAPTTIYHWASITKTFTGIAIMQLRDRGASHAGCPCRHLRPRAETRAQPVRRHLAGDNPHA